MIFNSNLDKRSRHKAKEPLDFFAGPKPQRKAMSDFEILMQLERACTNRHR